MLSLLADIVMRFQWPKVRKEIRRLFPDTLALVEQMEKELERAVFKIGHGAYGVNIACLTKEVTIYAGGLKITMEGLARISLGLPCSEEIKRFIGADKSGFLLKESMSDLEWMSRVLIFKKDGQECVFLPHITRKPSFFIPGSISDPWFVYSTGKIPKMVEG